MGKIQTMTSLVQHARATKCITRILRSAAPIHGEKAKTDELGTTSSAADRLTRNLDRGHKRLHLITTGMTPLKIILVEDNAGDADLIREMLDDDVSQRVEITHLVRISQIRDCLADDQFDVMVLDLGLPDAQGLEAVRAARACTPNIPLVVLTGLDDGHLASLALEEGAQDYLLKGEINARGLRRALRYAIDRKAIEEKLFAEQESARVTLNSIADAVISADLSGNITFLNSVAEKLTGWQQNEALGRPIADILKVVDEITREPRGSTVERPNQLHRSTKAPSNSILVRRDGSELPIDESRAPILDRQGQIAGTVTVLHDVSVTRAMELKMAHLAQHDFLTDLPNRRVLDDRLRQAISLARRQGKQLAVLFVDIDRFKHINDSLGHGMGDKALQSMAERLTTCVRASDTVARQGGDEFVILLAEVTTADDAAIVAKKILSAVALPHRIGRHELQISASIGISTCPNDADDAETLIKHADIAMYQAKEKGRNNYQFFRADMNERVLQRQSLESSLRLALERQEFLLHYQPKMNLETGHITGMEALIRWRHPELGLVPPASFIGVAEDCGLMQPIGRWVLQEACRQVKEWMVAGLNPVPVAVNVSAVEFRRKHFFDGVISTLRETDLDPRYLELELTETVLMKEAEPTIAVLHALKSAGVKLAIDDFGTGYSSLSYLTRLPVDTLKIDRSFVTDVTTRTDNAAIVSAIIGMGKSLNLNVIAEGVETQEQLALLRSHCCAEGQGYYFSRPVSVPAVAELLNTELRTSPN
uniref:GGDEF family protein n=1 Tax=uncultured bacterium BLR9 TaxID=506525 RepID=C0INC4_9BACT|nr:GGDEF family protein [uncultured bacterium BLR9]